MLPISSQEMSAPSSRILQHPWAYPYFKDRISKLQENRNDVYISSACSSQWHITGVFLGNNFFGTISAEKEGCPQCQLMID